MLKNSKNDKEVCFMSIDLYEHNQTAYKDAISMQNDCNKAAIVHPTGTGKLKAERLQMLAEKWHKDLKNIKKPHAPLPINGREYCFEDGV